MRRQHEARGDEGGVRDRHRQEREDGECKPGEIDHKQPEPETERRPRTPHEHEAGRGGDLAKRSFRLADRERPQQDLVEREDRGEVEGENRERPGERSCFAVEAEGDDGREHGDSDERTQDTPGEAAAKSRSRLEKRERSGLHDGTAAETSVATSGPTPIRSTSASGTAAKGEDREHVRGEGGVEQHEPPGLLVEVPDRAAEGLADRGGPEPRRGRDHPFTPAAATPATKYRWKKTYTTSTGTMAMVAAAISCGQSVWYWKRNCTSPI